MSGQRLTVPEPEIKLYKQGFEAASDLGRASDGKKLSDLVERIEEPMVIAVDAPWGAGKSVFLKCWVGAHTKDNGGEATTVYFDAFKNDFMGDPLVSIFKEVSDRIESLKPKTADEAEQQRIAKLKALSGKAKKYAPILGRAALRLALGTAATEAIMDIENPDESSLDEMLENASSEAAKAIGSFWQAEDTRTQAMDGFRTYLTELAAEQKLVIVVDELDRCRPDYALNLLEVIKHFFNVPNVHFVLGVNLTELENSVRARYGAGANASKYLQKFYRIRMPLPLKAGTRDTAGKLYTYFKKQALELGMQNENYLFAFEVYFKAFQHLPNFSLRDTNTILTDAMLCSTASKNAARLEWYLSAGLIALKTISPSALKSLRTLQTFPPSLKEQIFSQLGFNRYLGAEPPEQAFNKILMPNELDLAILSWEWLFAQDPAAHVNKEVLDRGLTNSAPSSKRHYLDTLIQNSVDTFEFVKEN
ncbi:KAP family P-loop NTPase fold protein [Celeribacter sp. SCSIO 80788]|uniref:KAP family P-loop NTPase fold protein n=1 Tax=Celeribacter sp. SCSIO 80788 TaxID=3117013 RepID=UPI003DA4F218